MEDAEDLDLTQDWRFNEKSCYETEWNFQGTFDKEPSLRRRQSEASRLWISIEIEKRERKRERGEGKDDRTFSAVSCALQTHIYTLILLQQGTSSPP